MPVLAVMSSSCGILRSWHFICFTPAGGGVGVGCPPWARSWGGNAGTRKHVTRKRIRTRRSLGLNGRLEVSESKGLKLDANHCIEACPSRARALLSSARIPPAVARVSRPRRRAGRSPGQPPRQRRYYLAPATIASCILRSSSIELVCNWATRRSATLASSSRPVARRALAKR